MVESGVVESCYNCIDFINEPVAATVTSDSFEGQCKQSECPIGALHLLCTGWRYLNISESDSAASAEVPAAD